MSNRPNFKKISVHDGPKQSLGFLLWHISTSWRSAVEAILKTFGLTHPQFVVLATTGWLTRNGDLITQIAIGNMAGLDPNTNSQIIKGLEQRNLIKRNPCSDGRAKNVFLTAKGSEVLNYALPAVEQVDVKFFNSLTKNETDSLVGIFQKLTPREIVE